MLDEFQKDQPIVYQILKNTVQKQNFSHAYLLEMNGYSKGLDLATSFAKEIFCVDKDIKNCEHCHICKMVESGNYPELRMIEPDGMWIKKEQLVELQEEFSKKAIIGNKKIYIINHVDHLNQASANSILKFLEEPEENIIAILITDNVYQVLPTIQSRCQIVSFSSRNLLYENAQDEKSKIAAIIASREEEYQQLIEQNSFQEKINAAIHFVQYYEENGYITVLYTQKLWHDFFSEKSDFSLGFQLVSLYYKDILNALLHRKTEIFTCDDKMKRIISKNKEQTIAKKIKTVLELRQAIQVNANNNLLMDKLILSLQGGDVV